MDSYVPIEWNFGQLVFDQSVIRSFCDWQKQKNINLCHNIWTIRNRDIVFDMHYFTNETHNKLDLQHISSFMVMCKICVLSFWTFPVLGQKPYICWGPEKPYVLHLSNPTILWTLRDIFISPSSDGSYYGMVMSVRVSVSHSFPHFSPSCFDVLSWNLACHFLVMNIRSSSSVVNFCQVL